MTENSRPFVVFCVLIVLAVLVKALFIPAGMDRSAPRQAREVQKGMEEAVIRNISPVDAKSNMATDKRIVLLDVRTLEEYNERHITGAVLVPLDKADVFIPALARLLPDKTAVIYVYCRSGRRSRDAVGLMQVAGYVNVFNLGGIKDWPFETEP